MITEANNVNTSLTMYSGTDLWDGTPAIYISAEPHGISPDDFGGVKEITIAGHIRVPREWCGRLLPQGKVFKRFPKLARLHEQRIEQLHPHHNTLTIKREVVRFRLDEMKRAGFCIASRYGDAFARDCTVNLHPNYDGTLDLSLTVKGSGFHVHLEGIHIAWGKLTLEPVLLPLRSSIAPRKKAKAPAPGA